tara:strand:- start:184 stop:1044 length:861 start_codon:yes stop_codon:yes gene_type:complete
MYQTGRRRAEPARHPGTAGNVKECCLCRHRFEAAANRPQADTHAFIAAANIHCKGKGVQAMSQTIVITGANRGIGYDMARLWKARGNHVIAVCRGPAEKKGKEDLHDLGIRVLEGYNVSKAEDVAALKEELGDTEVDVLYNNAGIMESETLENMNFDTIEKQFEVNTLGPLRVTHALLDNLSDGARVGLMTSRMGSIEDNDSGRKYGYRISKAGLNAAGKSLAVDLKDRGVAVAILHPGYVKTDMTGHTGHITPEQAAHRLVQRMDELNLDNTGTFWHSDGSVLPW